MEKLKFLKREEIGKKIKKLLSEDFVPAVVYNSKGESTNIKISKSQAFKIYQEATSTSIFDAQYGKNSLKVLVKEINIHPLSDQIRHIAFFEIDEKKEMDFTIPFELVGVSPAVKNNLGILVEVLPSIEVRCTLANLVPFLEIDISKLEHPGQSISLDEIEIPKGIQLLNEDLASATVVTITEMEEEEVIEPEEEKTEEEDEVIEGEKREEKEEGKQEEPSDTETPVE